VNARRRGTAFVNPLYHLSAFSIRNPWVQWAIEHGAYQDLAARPVNAADFGDAESLEFAKQFSPEIRYRANDPSFRYPVLRR